MPSKLNLNLRFINIPLLMFHPIRSNVSVTLRLWYKSVAFDIELTILDYIKELEIQLDIGPSSRPDSFRLLERCLSSFFWTQSDPFSCFLLCLSKEVINKYVKNDGAASVSHWSSTAMYEKPNGFEKEINERFETATHRASFADKIRWESAPKIHCRLRLQFTILRESLHKKLYFHIVIRDMFRGV